MLLQSHARCLCPAFTVWNPARHALLQYVRSLTSAAERGLSWFLRKEPADFSELRSEAFHCALFAGVVCGHHKTVETILQHQNPKRAALRLPTCIQIIDPHMASGSKQPGEQVSCLALAYGWEDYARQYPMSKEESHLRWDRGFCLFGSQCLGLMQLLLEYGVHRASAIEGLLPKLVCTLDMAAVELLQAYHLDIGERELSDGCTMLHLLVSIRSCTTFNPLATTRIGSATQRRHCSTNK